MATRAERRALLVPLLARALRSRDLRNALATGPGMRELEFIPVLPDDTMSYLWDRLRETTGAALVAVERTEGRIGEIAAMVPATAERMTVALEDDQIVDVNDASTVEMFLTLMSSVGGGRDIVLRKTSVRLLDSESLQSAR